MGKSVAKVKPTVDELEAQLSGNDEVGEEFDFDELDSDAGSFLNKWVKIKDEEEGEIYGLVVLERPDGVLDVETIDDLIGVASKSVTLVRKEDVPGKWFFEFEEELEEPEEEEPEEEEAEEEAEEEEPEEEEAEAEAEEEEPEEEAEEEAEVETKAKKSSGSKKGSKNELAEILAIETQVLPLSKVKVPRSKPRGVNKKSKKYLEIKNDIADRGQREAIKVSSFKNPEICDGLRRYTALKELGAKEILCVEDGAVKDAQDRLMNGFLDNEMREPMTLLEKSQCLSLLAEGDKYSISALARKVGVERSTVVKMIALTKLPKAIHKVLKGQAENPDEAKYSAATFLELTSAPDSVKETVSKSMEKGTPVTIRDIRALKKESEKAKADQEGKSEAPSKGKGKDEGSTGMTYKRLPREVLGERISLTVRKEEVELKISLPWKRKTFKGMNLVDELKALFDDALSDPETIAKSFESLNKEMTSARSELV